jgi:hypothetical protein
MPKKFKDFGIDVSALEFFSAIFDVLQNQKKNCLAGRVSRDADLGSEFPSLIL